MRAQTAEEARLALLELGVARPHAGDDPNELGKRLRKHGERHQRQDEVLGVEVPVQVTGALRVADALGRLDPGLAALVLGDRLAIAATERLPLAPAHTVHT